MCLIVKCSKIDELLTKLKIKRNSKPKIAKKDIKVYKLLAKINFEYITPFRETLINFDNGKTNLPIVKIKAYKWINWFYVEEGYHSFSTYEQAKYVKSQFPDSYNIVLLNAIIPKGTKYFIGENDTIVSEKLIIYQH